MKNPMSLEALIDWLETKPAGELYDYTNGKNCLIAQYFDFLGINFIRILPSCWVDEKKWYKLPRYFNSVANPGSDFLRHCGLGTFGNALKRAKAIQKKELSKGDK